MIYVVSDLHGYPLQKFKTLLKSAHFSGNDFLYILGDVIDRNGDGGIEMLRWLLCQQNIQLLLGNHEAMLLSCQFVFEEITNESVQALTTEKLELLNNYMLNGGTPTLTALRQLGQTDRQEVLDILDYLQDAPLFETVSAGGNDFLLVHAGLDHFSPDKKISQYTPDDLLWAWPEIGEQYYDDIITIFGHTPTFSYNQKYDGKIIKNKTWIDIDVGAGSGREPVLLRLDDFQEYRL